ncbi:MAG: phosphatidylinositol-specific phospholipase C/glycerophosphodiester phosphodiesterase family protein [Phycisphaerae bacterium]|nr:phosphatidylinositol-specific phospholipase C/glycerophosphodiester phosphodiesterase family protein [Phycisphaerae bacterium]
MRMHLILFCCFVSVCMASQSARAVFQEPTPLARAHAHNDYRHHRPLLDALAHGFTSVEADIYLVDGQLLVAHDRDEIEAHRTLQALYLDPLRALVEQHGGSVYAKKTSFTLLIDFKTEAESTYAVLHSVLSQYKACLTSFTPQGRQERAILVVVSGNRPRETMAAQALRYAGCDGRLSDLNSNAPADLILMISDNWGSHFTWQGKGPMPAEERARLKDIVTISHKKGRVVRFWATPDQSSPEREALWNALVLANVDVINTDDLCGLQQFLLARLDK